MITPLNQVVFLVVKNMRLVFRSDKHSGVGKIDN